MIPAVVVWMLVVLLLGFVYLRLSRHPLDPLALFCYFFFFFYVFRESAITLGVDGPYPDYLFQPGQTPQILVLSGLGLICFLVAFVGVYTIFLPFASARGLIVPVVWHVPSVRRQVRLVAALTSVATLISVFLLARYGGITGLVSASKRTGTLAGSYELRIFPAVGAVTAAALTVALWQGRREVRTRRPILMTLALCAALLNAGFVMLWGSREAVAIVLLIMLAGAWFLRRGDEHVASRWARARVAGPRLPRLLAVAAIVVLAITGLRLVRDTLLNGHVSSTIQGQSTVRQLSVATNSTYFDAVLLAVRDWPSAHPYRGGEDFIIGAEAIIPRIAWPGKPQDVRPGSWFRQVYEPQHPNGWPLGAVGDWYLNFGFPGIFIGGALSGALYAGMMAIWRRAPWSPFNLAGLMAVVAFVAPTGIDALSPLHWFEWGLPLLFCARYLADPARMVASSRDDAPPGPMATSAAS